MKNETTARKLNTLIGGKYTPAFGDFILFQLYDPDYDPSGKTYKVSSPILAIALDTFVADQTIGINYVKYIPTMSEHRNPEIECYIEWSEYIDILGMWSHKPSLAEYRAAASKRCRNKAIPDINVDYETTDEFAIINASTTYQHTKKEIEYWYGECATIEPILRNNVLDLFFKLSQRKEYNFFIEEPCVLQGLTSSHLTLEVGEVSITENQMVFVSKNHKDYFYKLGEVAICITPESINNLLKVLKQYIERENSNGL